MGVDREFEKGFEEIMVFIFLFLIITSLSWLLLGNHQISSNPLILIIVGIVSSGLIAWYLYK